MAAIACLSAGLFIAALPFMKGAKLLSVQTASMSPIFRPGDAVWVEKVPPDSLSRGDIISYRNPNDPGIIVSHRLISIDSREGILITKGDNVSLNDLPVYPGLFVGKVTRVIPKAGYVLDWLHRPLGILLAVYTPGLLLLLSEFKRLAAHQRHTSYLQPRHARSLSQDMNNIKL